MSVKDVDKGVKALLARLADANGSITVGVHADSGNEPGGSSTVDVASYQEFGTDTIPARSFLRAWFDGNGPKIRDTLRRAGNAVVAGRLTPKQALGQAGDIFVGEIQKRIVGGIAPDLKDNTIRRKGSNTPLVDTGHLKSSITRKVGGV